MNPKQKKTFIASVSLAAASIITWIAYGGHVFTHTQILIEKKDDLFPDVVQKQWVNKFIWGLDLTLAICFASIIVGSILFYLFRNKKIS